MKTIAFYDTKPYDRVSFDAQNESYGCVINYFTERLNQHTASFAVGADVVCAFVNDAIDAPTIAALEEAKVGLIALRCAGYNNVDLKAAYNRIHVVRVPGYSPHAVAEHAVALMMALNRKTHRAYYRTRDGNFAINGLLGFDLHKKIAGVVGTGRIGRTLVPILQGFGMNVLLYDVYPDHEFAKNVRAQYVGLDELYAQSDVISLHCPLTPETHYLINQESIAKMKPGTMIINTGRGGLVKTPDLINALKDGRVGAAGLDVYEEEGDYFFEDLSSTMISDDVLARLLTFPNVLVTSHQGFFTKEALSNIAQTTLENVKEYYEGTGAMSNEICYRCGNDCLRKQNVRCF